MAVTPRIELAVGIDAGSAPESLVILCYESNIYPTDPSEFAGAVDDFSDQIGAVLKPALSASATFTGVNGRQISANTSQFYASGSSAGAGTVTGDCLPAQDGVLIRKRGQGPAKRASGRNWWPGIAESHATTSKLNATGLTAWQPVANFLFATLSVGMFSWTPVIMSRVGNVLYPVQYTSVVDVICTQRRRRPAV